MRDFTAKEQIFLLHRMIWNLWLFLDRTSLLPEYFAILCVQKYPNFLWRKTIQIYSHANFDTFGSIIVWLFTPTLVFRNWCLSRIASKLTKMIIPKTFKRWLYLEWIIDHSVSKRNWWENFDHSCTLNRKPEPIKNDLFALVKDNSNLYAIIQGSLAFDYFEELLFNTNVLKNMT